MVICCPFQQIFDNLEPRFTIPLYEVLITYSTLGGVESTHVAMKQSDTIPSLIAFTSL